MIIRQRYTWRQTSKTSLCKDEFKKYIKKGNDVVKSYVGKGIGDDDIRLKL